MRFSSRSKVSIALLSIAAIALVSAFAVTGLFRSQASHAAGGAPFISGLHHIAVLASTVPKNGDINPYGVAVVPTSVGNLVKGNILISNFNAASNLQGTGTTIVQITPTGGFSLFAKLSATTLYGACPGGVGLTTALVVLQRGWVIVGSLPTTDGTAATAKAGCLIVLNSKGHAVETFTGSQINGPWDMTAADWGQKADLFVTNVLNGTVAANGNVVNQQTVLRIELNVPQQGEGIPDRAGTTVIGSKFSARTDPAALVIGPTGVGLGANGTLYVADTLSNRIAAIPHALTRQTSALAGADVTANGFLNNPLGLTVAPNGDILTVNGNDGNIVETTPSGQQVAEKLIDKTAGTGAGCLFGLTVFPNSKGVYFVDDCTNTLNTLR